MKEVRRLKSGMFFFSLLALVTPYFFHHCTKAIESRRKRKRNKTEHAYLFLRSVSVSQLGSSRCNNTSSHGMHHQFGRFFKSKFFKDIFTVCAYGVNT